jgi:FkbM family methyltransferase
MSMDKSQIEADLNRLLSEDLASAVKRERTTFDEQTTPFSDRLILFGAGGLGRKTLAGLRKVGIEPLAFADNNASLWGREVEGVQVMSPKLAAQQYANYSACVVCIWGAGSRHRIEHTRRQLQNLGCSKIVSFVPLFWKYPDLFLPYYAIDLPHKILSQAKNIAAAYALWSDESSRYEFLAQVRWRLLQDFDGLPSPVAQEQYFPEDLFSLSMNEVFVDCGAYDGDSLRAFLLRQPAFKGTYIAIEPDPINLHRLKQYVTNLPDNLRYQIHLIPMALGVQRGIVRFAATGLASAGIDSSGMTEVESIALDEILENTSPSYIKMDIEGAELDALIGAQRSIRKAQPALAICVYHKPDHMWRIPLLIQSLHDQYKFYLRPYNEEAWDLVCYAVPNSRLGS